MNNLPLELIEYILFNINDSKTYLNSRLVCRRWLNILKEVKLYENYILKNIVTFNDSEIIYYNNKRIKIGEIIFSKYGYYKYIEYDKNSNINITIYSKPLKLEKNTSTPYMYETIKYDIYKNKQSMNTINTSMYRCNLM